MKTSLKPTWKNVLAFCDTHGLNIFEQKKGSYRCSFQAARLHSTEDALAIHTAIRETFGEQARAIAHYPFATARTVTSITLKP